jgi:hypothetical protein
VVRWNTTDIPGGAYRIILLTTCFHVVFCRLILRLWGWRQHVIRNIHWLSTDYTALYPRRQFCSQNYFAAKMSRDCVDQLAAGIRQKRGRANELDGREYGTCCLLVQARGPIFTDGTRRGQLRAMQVEDHCEQQVIAGFVLWFSVSELQLAENDETARSYSVSTRHVGRNFMSLYKMSQEQRSIFWEVTVFVILSKKYICTYVLFWKVSEIELFHCTVVWFRRPIMSFPPAYESVWCVSWPLWLLIVTL